MKNKIYLAIRFILLLFVKKKALKTILMSVAYEIENKNKTSVTEKVLEKYNNRKIGNYATIARPLARDLHYAFHFKMVLDYIVKNKFSAVEIGCAAGDFLNTCAKKVPDKKFIGIDFNVDIAIKNFITGKKRKKNLKFIEGYVQNLELPKVDAAVFISTATCLFPIELLKTFKKISASSISTIILSEPWWWRQSISVEDRKTNSSHAKFICWNHAYPGLLKKAGYKIIHLEKQVEKQNTEKLFIVASK